MGAFLPLAVGGAGALMSLFGGGGGGTSKEVQSLLADLMRRQIGTYDVTQPYANQAVNFWGSALTGGNAAKKAYGPTLEDINKLYSGTASDIETFLPRGGERNLALAQIPIERAGAQSRVLAEAQPMAAQQLLSALLGTSQAPVATGQTLASIAGQQQYLNAQRYQSSGQSLGALAAAMLLKKGKE